MVLPLGERRWSAMEPRLSAELASRLLVPVRGMLGKARTPPGVLLWVAPAWPVAQRPEAQRRLVPVPLQEQELWAELRPAVRDLPQTEPIPRGQVRTTMHSQGLPQLTRSRG